MLQRLRRDDFDGTVTHCMDSWVVALRGDEDALVPVRGLLGAPVAWLGALEVFSCDTVDPVTAGGVFARLAELAPGAGGAVVLEGTQGPEARARAVALACAAVAGEILVDSRTRARLDGALLFVSASARDGWTLPLPAAALAPVAPRRADARRAVSGLPVRPRLVARAREVGALVTLMKSPGVAVVRADTAMGGGRIVQEAADRLEKTFDRLPLALLRQPTDEVIAQIERFTGDWLVIDPVSAGTVEAVEALVAKLASTHPVIVRLEPDVAFSRATPDSTVDVGPLRAYDRQALVYAMLGDKTDAALVRRIARRGSGAPARIVEAVRACVQLGEIARDGDVWLTRERRPLRPRHLPPDPVTSRMTDLPTPLYRALAVMTSVGSGSREAEMLAALRATLTDAPAALLEPLAALAFVEIAHDGVQISGSLHALLPFDDPRVARAAATGALAFASRAELLLRANRGRDAAVSFAKAARNSLDDGMLAAAVRFAAAAHDSCGAGPRPDDVVALIEAVTAALGPVVMFAPAPDDLEATGSRIPLLDPDALDERASRCATRGADALAARLRALAAVLRGDGASADAATLPGDGNDAADVARLAISTAVVQAATGEVSAALRTTLGVLARARRSRSLGAERASLALLGTLFRAAGRDEEARRMSLRMQALGTAPSAS